MPDDEEIDAAADNRGNVDDSHGGTVHDVDDDFDDEYDDESDDEADGNRLEGGRSYAVLEYIAQEIVDEPDAVVIEHDQRRGGVTLRLHVAPDDMGKVIGKRGRVAQAIRTVVRAAGAREQEVVNVDIVD